MTRADRVLSTPPLNASSNNVTDPVYAAIEKHRKAQREYYEVLRVIVPGTCSPDPEKENKYGNRESVATNRLPCDAPRFCAFATIECQRDRLARSVRPTAACFYYPQSPVIEIAASRTIDEVNHLTGITERARRA